MSDIRFYNRYTKQLETEKVYGEGYLRWTYESLLGRVGLWALVRRAFFSNWYGRRMGKASSVKKIAPFIAQYGLDPEEFADEVSSYRSFNDFFYRKLKAGARPLCAEPKSIALPADGRHLGVANLSTVDGLYAKGQHFDLEEFLGSRTLGRHFEGGTAVISRLCPVDYHRFHSPVSGTVERQQVINGWLYSVSPIALRRAAHYLWENKRVLSIIDTPEAGTVAFVAIGATCVGSIEMTAHEGDKVEKGGELGYFAFGGSCVVTIFEAGRVKLAEDLRENGSSQLVEVYAKFGDVLGFAV